ncbi:MAG TPA: GspMb/PilO family protein [Candidatus Woesebacteria bacterium]|nr:GspMb/PilO family protein [Candidatus Woesebacteria bacterium]HPJ17132.1 GspMb/PilO family protein [Candidatus Woesebacteria bacterium]
MKLNLEIPETLFGLDSGLIKVFFLPFLVTISLILSIGLVITPQIDKFKLMSGSNQKIEKETKDLRAKVDYLASLDQNELQKNAGFVNNSLLPEKNSYLLVNIVRKIADRYGFGVDSFNISIGNLNQDQQKSSVGGISRIPVNVKLIGDKEKQYDLIEGLEKSLPVLSVDDFKIKSNNSNTIEMEMTLSAFYIENKDVLANEKLTLAELTMKKEESEVINKLSNFTMMENISAIEGSFETKKDFTKFERNDPFTL